MTTALDLITDAMLEAGVGSIGDAVADDVAQFGLRKLNRMLESWATESLMVFDIYRDSFVMTPGVASYSSALLAQGRPVSVDYCFVRLANIDYDIEIINNQQYDDIAFKSTAGLPDRCYPDIGFPNDTFFFYPTPAAAYTAFFDLRRQLTAGTLLVGTTVALPPGYELAIVSNLAMALWGPFKRPPRADLVETARESKATLKRLNRTPMVMDTDLPIGRRIINIQRGY